VSNLQTGFQATSHDFYQSCKPSTVCAGDTSGLLDGREIYQGSDVARSSFVWSRRMGRILWSLFVL